MSVTFTRYQDRWCLSSEYPLTAGSTVTVHLRNGTTEQKVVGAAMGQRNNWLGTNSRRIRYIYAVAEQPRTAPDRSPADGPAVVGYRPAAPTTVQLDAARLFEMFDVARTHLTRCIVRVPQAGDEEALRLERGTEQTLRVLRERPRRPGSRLRRLYGTISRHGVFTPRAGVEPLSAAQLDALQAFGHDPVGRARAHGRRTGQCCFCGQGLTDSRSVSVGYGPICADHYGLPWGDRPARASASAAGARQEAARLADGNQRAAAAVRAAQADADERETEGRSEEDFVYQPPQHC